MLTANHLRVIKNISLQQININSLNGATDSEAIGGVPRGLTALDTLLRRDYVTSFTPVAKIRHPSPGTTHTTPDSFTLYRLTELGMEALAETLQYKVSQLLKCLGKQLAWKRVPYGRARHVWKSACACDPHEVAVAPDYYGGDDKPSCIQCGKVYDYLYTEVLQ